MANIILLNKPFNVLCQFTGTEGETTLAKFIKDKGFYPAGRLDKDSEGLVLLTDNGQLQHQISHPNHKLEKTYWVQVEGDIDSDSLRQFRSGLKLKDGNTLPAKAKKLTKQDNHEAKVWPRTPPIRVRNSIPTSWIEVTIREGRNRQVRRMTAHIGFPTLRLIRIAIGNWRINAMQPGEYRNEQVHVAPPKTKQTKFRRR